jgi:uncharacterized protein YndB with AHSA1/START domain
VGETRLDFSYRFPLDRVWSALTDRRLLAAWLMESDIVPVRGHRFMLWPRDLPGLPGPITATVLDIEPPRRLSMGWQGTQGQAQLRYELRPSRRGCRLRVTYSGDLTGVDGRASLLSTLRTLFADRLPAVLSDPGANTPPMPGVGPAAPDPPMPVRPARPSAEADKPVRRPRVVLLAVIVVLIPGAAVGGLLLLPYLQDGGAGSTGSGRLGAAPSATSLTVGPGGPTTVAPVGAGGASGAGGPPSSPGGSARPSTPAVVAPGKAAATYTVSDVVPGTSYRVDVTVSNQGGASVQGWTVTMRLSGVNLIVVDLGGATHAKQGNDYAFTPNPGTASIPPGGSVHFSFTVAGVESSVVSCSIDGAPC